MNDQVDQFGRDKRKTPTDFLNTDKSKKILDSLAEIKKQLENKNYTPKTNENDPSLNKNLKILKSQNSDFEQLNKKIEYLETKLTELINQFEFENLSKGSQINLQNSSEKSVFHIFNNENKLDKGKSLLVLEKQNQSLVYKVKFHHFLFTTIFFIMTLVMLISFMLDKSFIKVINIFLSKFN